MFRVGCITKKGAGPFSDASAPVVMATHPEGKTTDLKHDVSCCCTCVILIYRCKVVIYTSTDQCTDNYKTEGYSMFTCIYSVCADTHIPLIQTEALGSKVTGSERPTTQKNFNFLSEINRWDFEVEDLILIIRIGVFILFLPLSHRHQLAIQPFSVPLHLLFPQGPFQCNKPVQRR